eukprot:scaffold75275_cov24-Phaeocystis_antarctica.AAC.1
MATLSLSAVLREQREVPRGRQLLRDGRLAHSRRTTQEDQRPGSPSPAGLRCHHTAFEYV